MRKIYVERGGKRFFDLMVSIAALVLCSLPVLLIALAIKLDSRGPVFFIQKRRGKDGKPFMISKFRTMWIQDCGSRDLVTSKCDPRITRVGRFLRGTHLDELPQVIIDVLVGDMSIVGPRPEEWMSAERLAKTIPDWDKRHEMRPGVTGWEQIFVGRQKVVELGEFLGRLKEAEAAASYKKGLSLFLDLRIMVLTIPHCLGWQGA